MSDKIRGLNRNLLQIRNKTKNFRKKTSGNNLFKIYEKNYGADLGKFRSACFKTTSIAKKIKKKFCVLCFFLCLFY